MIFLICFGPSWLNNGYNAGLMTVERAGYQCYNQNPGGVEAFVTGSGRNLCQNFGLDVGCGPNWIVASTNRIHGSGNSSRHIEYCGQDCAIPYALVRDRVTLWIMKHNDAQLAASTHI